MMKKKVAVVQSNYIPWKGYFDLINSVDEFILYDDMQYTRRDWRNRNLIKTFRGLQWLTIPVEVKGKFFQKINSTVVSMPDWNIKHWLTVRQNYARAPYFRDFRALFEEVYLGATSQYLSQINFHFITAICKVLGIRTKITWSMDYNVDAIEDRTMRLVELCKLAGATHYLSGPSARGYMDETYFEGANINVKYIDYSGYKEYPQLFLPFEHGVTVLDLIFNTGSEASSYLKGFDS